MHVLFLLSAFVSFFAYGQSPAKEWVTYERSTASGAQILSRSGSCADLKRVDVEWQEHKKDSWLRQINLVLYRTPESWNREGKYYVSRMVIYYQDSGRTGHAIFASGGLEYIASFKDVMVGNRAAIELKYEGPFRARDACKFKIRVFSETE